MYRFGSYQMWGFVVMGIILGNIGVSAQEATFRKIKVSPSAVVTGMKVEKACSIVTLYVEGYVEDERNDPLSGALVTGTLSDAEIDEIEAAWYFDQDSIFGGSCFHCHYPNGLSVSRAFSYFNGYYELRFDLCVNTEVSTWDAEFEICVSLEGFIPACDKVSCDEDTATEECSFSLDLAPTATLSLTPTLTFTPSIPPTPTATTTPTPSHTATHSGLPLADHPEFDADEDGVIGPEDLLLFLKDWKHRSR